MKQTTSCPGVSDVLRLLLGQTGEEDSAPLEEHLFHCADCLRAVQALPADDALVAALRQGHALDAPSSSNELLEKLQRQLQETRPPIRAQETADAESGAAVAPPGRLLPLAPPRQPDEIGRLGGYRVLKEVGRGGMGVVYQAEDDRLKRAVAVKAMLPALASRPNAAKRFLREAQAVAAVEHDHIVRIYQVGEDRDIPFLAMEFLRGEPLEERLKRDGKLPVAEVLRIGREIAEGLAAAHERGLVHRDIKPGNIWLQGEPGASATGGRVKILDFGLARAASADSALTQEGAIVGTPAYMAPEQARGEAVDARCDLFSLGVLLYRLCTGRMPFKGSDAVSLLLSITTHQPAPPIAIDAGLPPALSNLIMSLLEKDPARRPAGAGEAAPALQALEQKPTREREAVERGDVMTPAARPPAAPPWRRRRLVLAVAVAVLLGGLIAVAAVLIRITTDQGDYVVETDDPDFSFQVHGDQVTLRDLKTNKTYNLAVERADKKSGEMELNLTAADGDLSFQSGSLTIKRGERVALRASVARGRPSAANPPTDEDEESWRRWAAALPPDLQVQAVAARLKERNPRFNETLSHWEVDGHVNFVRVPTEDVTDLTPLLAMGALRELDLRGAYKPPLLIGPSRFADLSQLKDLKDLTAIECSGTPVSDLSALKGKPCRRVACAETPVADLSPLHGMPLNELWCGGTRVKDLSPLRGTPLTMLGIDNTPVSELSPLEGLKLTYLNCAGIKATNLSALKGMPLTNLFCMNVPVSDLSPLEGMKLTNLECDLTHIADLSVLRGMPLVDFECRNTLVADLSPLHGAPLTRLAVPVTRVKDLSPLRGMALTFFSCRETKVSDLSPLRGMPLTELCCEGAAVTDLSPLKGMPLRFLTCDYKPERDAAILRTIPTLETINKRPAKEVLDGAP